MPTDKTPFPLQTRLHDAFKTLFKAIANTENNQDMPFLMAVSGPVFFETGADTIYNEKTFSSDLLPSEWEELGNGKFSLMQALLMLCLVRKVKLIIVADMAKLFTPADPSRLVEVEYPHPSHANKNFFSFFIPWGNDGISRSPKTQRSLEWRQPISVMDPKEYEGFIEDQYQFVLLLKNNVSAKPKQPA